jgi:hypothetical protein
MKRRNFAFISGLGNRPGGSSIFHFRKNGFLEKGGMKLDLAWIYRLEHLLNANPAPWNATEKDVFPPGSLERLRKGTLLS